MTKRNKKYNPNKVSNLVGRNANKIHHLWMSYDNDVVEKITDEWLKENEKEDVPTKLLYPHINGDLIIAIKHRLISLEQDWTIKMTFYIRKLGECEIEEVEIDFQFPRCHMQEIKSHESDIKIDRGAGIKTRWKGLDKEVEQALKPLADEGYVCESTWAYIACDTAFLSKADYSYFIQEKTLRLTLGEMVAEARARNGVAA